jgi:uncharacterized protein (TIGR03067 family)
MNQTQSCLSKETLDRIAHDEILPDELRCIEEHVSECEHCRGLFTAEATQPDWTESILPILCEGADELTEIDDGGTCSGHDSVFSLLGPTDDPQMLGRIGTYEVTGIIGRGGMGVVFKAFDAALNRFVAIKMLLPQLASSAAARKRFSREAQAAAAVLDDQVLPIYGVDEWQGVPYLVTQYVSGMSLQKRLHDHGALELKEILRISLQTARGLAAAHVQGLVHRDVKPSNILLDGTVERAMLTDFGLARAVDDASITRSGAIVGTPQFMAPEQARGAAVDRRSDLFSLGAVMYTMCTGRPPFRADSSYGVLRRIIDEQPRSIREINPEIPGWCCDIVNKLMAKQPQDRFVSAEEVAGLLEECLAHVQQPMSVPLPQTLAVSASASNRSSFPPITKWLAAAVAFLFLVLAGTMIVLELNKGQLHIRCAASDVPIRIMQGDEVVKKFTVSKDGTTVRLSAGNYIVAIDGDFDNLVVAKETVSLLRGTEQTVSIVRTAAPEDAGQTKMLAAMQGKWLVVRNVDVSQNVDEPDPDSAEVLPMPLTMLEVKGHDIMTIRNGKPLASVISFVIDATHSPMHIDVTDRVIQDDNVTAPPGMTGSVFLPGVFAVTGDTMKLCTRRANSPQSDKRPAELAPQEGTVYLELQRVDRGLAAAIQQVLKTGNTKYIQQLDSGTIASAREMNAADGAAFSEEQIGTVLGKPVFAADLNEHVELREDLERLFVRPVEAKYLQDQQLDPEEELQRRIPDEATRLAALMLVRQRVLHEHLHKTRGGRVLLTAFGPIAYDAHRQWLQERERAGDFQLTAAKHRDLIFAPLAAALQSRLTEDPNTIRQAFDPAIREAFISRMSQMQAIGDRVNSTSLAAIEAQLAVLPATVHHDFVNAGLPADLFDVQGQDANKRAVAASDGIQVSHPGQAGYSNTAIETRLRVHGNFEVTVSFEDFQYTPGNNGSGAISLTAILDNELHTHISIQRGARVEPGSPVWHFIQSEFVHSPQREPGVVWLGTRQEDATSGRLRMARVGGMLSCLLAAGDSSEFRLIHTEEVGSADLLFGGIRLNTGEQCNGSEHGTTSVKWKDVTIRAERISDWQGEIDNSP